MSTSRSQASLSHSERRLLQLMQEIHYGRIDGLVVRDGEPHIEASTRVLRDVKFGPASRKRPVLIDHNYLDNPQVVDMLQQFCSIGEGIVKTLEIHDGLPFRMQIVESVLA